MLTKAILLVGIFFTSHIYGSYPLAGTPATQDTSTGPYMMMGNDTPSNVASNTGAAFNTTAKTLSNPLNKAQVSLWQPPGYGYGNASLCFNFDASVISQIPSTVIANGLYASVNVSTGTYTWTGNTNKQAHKFDIILTDQAGHVYAQTTFYAPYSGTQYYWNATQIDVIFTDTQGKTADVLNIPISTGKRAFFKGTGGHQHKQPIHGGGSKSLANVTSIYSSNSDYALDGTQFAYALMMVGYRWSDYQTYIQPTLPHSYSTGHPNPLSMLTYTLQHPKSKEFTRKIFNSKGVYTTDGTQFAHALIQAGFDYGDYQTYIQPILPHSYSTGHPTPLSMLTYTLQHPSGEAGTVAGGGGAVMLGSGESLDYLALELVLGKESIVIPFPNTGDIGLSQVMLALHDKKNITVGINPLTTEADYGAQITAISGGTSIHSSFPLTIKSKHMPKRVPVSGNILANAYIVYKTNKMHQAVKDTLSVANNKVKQNYGFSLNANMAFQKIGDIKPGSGGSDQGGAFG